MDPLATTDLFKFLAVRPAHLVSQEETQRTLIRDEHISGRSVDGHHGQRSVRASGFRVKNVLAIRRPTEDPRALVESLAQGSRRLVRTSVEIDVAALHFAFRTEEGEIASIRRKLHEEDGIRLELTKSISKLRHRLRRIQRLSIVALCRARQHIASILFDCVIEIGPAIRV